MRFETSFLGGGPFFGSLYGSQLPQTPSNASSARYSGTFTVPASGDYTLRADRVGRGA